MDQMLLCWLISSLTEPVMAHVVGLTTSRDVWCALERIFASSSRARVQQLKYQLHTVKMGATPIFEYIQSVKYIVDNLAAVANPVTDSDLVSTLLSGLSPEYDSFVTSVNTRVDPISSEELIGLMLSQEIHRGHTLPNPESTGLISLASAVHTASRTSRFFSASPSSSFRGHGRG
ncbi:uncharacterized protein LOC131224165 [Magnolia sinica]|uniref:uncharacterized protein LOC131224165 n=1 Tax=Magnolia sinica TaxID=86752 RepID=UPI0026596E8B|nr:uncharacterized protein LOC131224165 [Magnolia sinica]